VLHRRIHGGPLAVPVDPPEPELTANERARISEFLAEVL